MLNLEKGYENSLFYPDRLGGYSVVGTVRDCQVPGRSWSEFRPRLSVLRTPHRPSHDFCFLRPSHRPVFRLPFITSSEITSGQRSMKLSSTRMRSSTRATWCAKSVSAYHNRCWRSLPSHARTKSMEADDHFHLRLIGATPSSSCSHRLHMCLGEARLGLDVREDDRRLSSLEQCSVSLIRIFRTASIPQKRPLEYCLHTFHHSY